MKFQSPDGAMVTSHPIDGVVDDTTVGASVISLGVSLFEEGHKIAQEWESLLFFSGGTFARKNAFFTT